jgi:cobalamin biosynthesis Mg chelatase CobN
MCEDHETPAILRALEGRFVRPAPGGDLLRTPEILPTGRNLHGFDPFRIPSVFAVREGASTRRSCSIATWRTAMRCPSPSRWCSGAPTT